MYKQNRCFPLITRHKIASPNSNLRLLHLYESYHKMREQFNRNLERYAKSPNSFLPGLPLLQLSPPVPCKRLSSVPACNSCDKLSPM